MRELYLKNKSIKIETNEYVYFGGINLYPNSLIKSITMQ